MAAPCERCRWRDEKEYTNLDDTEKHFLVLMRGDFQHEMIIPEEFVRRLNGEIPGEVKLQTRNGYSYTIEVSRDHEKLVLTAGWEQFVENFDLQMGDSIIFRYSGNSQFSVIIFDKLGREKALSVVVDAFLSHVKERNTEATETMNRSHGPQPMQMQSPTGTVNCSQVHPQPTQMQLSSKTVNHLPTQSPSMERQRRLQRDKSSQGNKTTMNYFSSESSGDSFSSEDVHKEHDVRGRNNIVGKKTRLSSVQKEQLKDGYITTRKAKLTLLQKEEVKEKVQSILSDIPVFVAVMGKRNVVSRCSLTVPNYYADEYLGNEQSMWLQRFGWNWKVSFPAKRKPHGCRRSIGGWHKFVEDNNMKMGDICLFERLNNQRCTMKVHIIHVKDGG